MAVRGNGNEVLRKRSEGSSEHIFEGKTQGLGYVKNKDRRESEAG